MSKKKTFSLIGLLISTFIFVACFIALEIVDEESTAGLIIAPLLLLSIPAVLVFAILFVVFTITQTQNKKAKTESSKKKKVFLIGLLISIFVFIAGFIALGIVDEESTAGLIIVPLLLLSIPTVLVFAILFVVFTIIQKQNEEAKTERFKKDRLQPDWHNFKVFFIYAIVLFVILLFLEPAVAFLALIGYSLYGLIDVLKAHKYKTKWYEMISPSVNEELTEIILCHITQRAEKFDGKVIKKFITDINAGNYGVWKETLTAIHSESPTSDEGYTYYLEFDNNGNLYYMSASRIHHFSVGDVMWHISTADHSTNVVKGSKGYNNLLPPFEAMKNKSAAVMPVFLQNGGQNEKDD